jgi:hypothetical protein
LSGIDPHPAAAQVLQDSHRLGEAEDFMRRASYSRKRLPAFGEVVVSHVQCHEHFHPGSIQSYRGLAEKTRRHSATT